MLKKTLPIIINSKPDLIAKSPKDIIAYLEKF